MIDLNSKHCISDCVNFFVDKAIAEQKEEPRKYLGASIVGHECERRVQYEYMVTQGMIESNTFFAPRIKRVLDRGNVYEERAIKWLTGAGFSFSGRQHQFDDFASRFAGHCDGIITDGVCCGITYPCLWECKCLQDKSYKAIIKDGLKKYSEPYWVQVHVYMAYLGLDRCMYTVVNANTMELYHFVVELDLSVARQARNRVERIINATAMGEMVPRCTSDKNYFVCKWCDYSSDCWNN